MIEIMNEDLRERLEDWWATYIVVAAESPIAGGDKDEFPGILQTNRGENDPRRENEEVSEHSKRD